MSAFTDSLDIEWVQKILMDPTVGHEAAAADLTFNGIDTSETAVRRWRKANGYQRAILVPLGKEPKGLNTLPVEGTPRQWPRTRN